jgi:hypothetical protein
MVITNYKFCDDGSVTRNVPPPNLSPLFRKSVENQRTWDENDQPPPPAADAVSRSRVRSSGAPAADDATIKIAVHWIGPALVFERLWEETGCRAVIAKRGHKFTLERGGVPGVLRTPSDAVPKS